jgi:Icc-related predicted phosphoesterase
LAIVTTIVCTADLHERLVDIPACDLLLIAGDVSFAFKGDLVAKQAFLAGEFKDWLDRVPAEEVVLVAGNHDQSIEAWGLPDGLRCHYLQDAEIKLFGRDRVELRREGPPHGYGDLTRGNEHVGSTAMTATLGRVRPRLMVCGHIHPAYGRYRLGETEIVNAALVDENYRPVNPVIEIELTARAAPAG